MLDNVDLDDDSGPEKSPSEKSPSEKSPSPTKGYNLEDDEEEV